MHCRALQVCDSYSVDLMAASVLQQEGFETIDALDLYTKALLIRFGNWNTNDFFPVLL